MAFIEESDYLPYIKDQNLQRLTQTDESILIAAEEVAIAIVRDALSGLYDADAIFATTGDARPKQVVLWVLRIVLYQLYERLPAGLTPERVRDNYMEVMAWLRDIEDGKKPTTLPRRSQTDDEGNTVVITKFRFGSALPQRTHEL